MRVHEDDIAAIEETKAEPSDPLAHIDVASIRKVKSQVEESKELERSRRTCVMKPTTQDLDLNLLGSAGFNCLHAACGSGNE